MTELGQSLQMDSAPKVVKDRMEAEDDEDAGAAAEHNDLSF
jgi:hypothetical protein